MELVNEVLDITQIENGQLRINSQPVNIPKLLDDFPPMLKQLQGDKKLNISMTFTRKPCWLTHLD